MALRPRSAAAVQVPDRVRKLVLYEPASPRIVEKEALGRLAGYVIDAAGHRPGYGTVRTPENL